MTQRRGFFGKLFDFSFSEFVATQIVGILYLIGLIFAAFLALAVIIGGFRQGGLAGLGALIISPFFFLLYAIFVRIGLETFVASIRTAENTREIAENTRRQGF